MTSTPRFILAILLLATFMGITFALFQHAQAYGTEQPTRYVGYNQFKANTITGTLGTGVTRVNTGWYCANDECMWDDSAFGTTATTQAFTRSTPGGGLTCESWNSTPPGFTSTTVGTVAFRFPGPVSADYLRFNYVLGAASGCTRAYLLTNPTLTNDFTTGKTELFASTSNQTQIEAHVNFTTTTQAYGILVAWTPVPSNALMTIYDMELRGKNDTRTPYETTLADTLAYSLNPATANIGTGQAVAGQVKLGVGNYHLYAYVPVTSSASNEFWPYTTVLETVSGGVDSWQTLGYSNAYRDQNNTAFCRMQHILIHNTAPGNLISVRTGTTGAAVYCANSNPPIHPPSPDWNAYGEFKLRYTNTAAAPGIAGYVYAENWYPIANPVTENFFKTPNKDLNCWSEQNFYCERNLTAGNRLTATYTNGTTLTLTYPRRVGPGNAIALYVAQDSNATIDSRNVQLFVNGKPAARLSPFHGGAELHSTSTPFNRADYTMFYIDDTARRNGQNLGWDNDHWQNTDRPFGNESYELTFYGWDSNYPLYALTWAGTYGHPYVACDKTGICTFSGNIQSIDLPANFTNYVNFTVLNTNGTPISSATIVGTTGGSKTTSASGFASFQNVTSTTTYTFFATGYQTDYCARFYLDISSFTSNGTDADGCVYIKAKNANFNITLLTLDEAHQSGTENATGGNATTPILVTFSPADCVNLTTGQRINTTITRSRSTDLYVSLFQLIGSNSATTSSAPYLWASSQPNTLIYDYPSGGNLTAGDTGQYLIVVYDATTDKILGYERIGVNAACDFPVPTTLLELIRQTITTLILTPTTSVNTPSLQKSATDDYLTALGWAYRTDLFLPNMWLIIILLMVGALLLRFVGRDSS